MVKALAWIEDDANIIDETVELLERAGHKIHRIRSVRDALDQVDLIRRCDLILLDIILPPGDVPRTYSRYSGVELLKQLREEYQVKTPALVLSVVSNVDVHRQLWELGIEGIIGKVILPSKFTERVEQILEKGRQ